jgi:hypothetical protein
LRRSALESLGQLLEQAESLASSSRSVLWAGGWWGGERQAGRGMRLMDHTGETTTRRQYGRALHCTALPRRRPAAGAPATASTSMVGGGGAAAAAVIAAAPAAAAGEVAELRSRLARVEASRDEMARQQGQYKASIAKV